MRAKWHSPRRAGTSVLKKALDTPNIVRDGREVADASLWLRLGGLLQEHGMGVFRPGGSLRSFRDPTRIGHNCELALTDVLDTDRQLLIVQRELTLTRERLAHAAQGSFRAPGGWTP